MARRHGKDSRLLVNERHASGDLRSWGATHTRAYGDITTVDQDGEKSLPGLIAGELRLAGVWDTSTGSLFDEAITALGTNDSLLVTVLPEGNTAGTVALLTLADPEQVTADAEITDAVGFDIAAKPDVSVDMGVLLHALGAETADGNGTAVDNAASSAGGAVASLHATAYTGLTNAVIKVQHSTDNSAFADLITFTTVTAATSELKTVTGTVNRYVRATVDVTGTGSVTYAVAFARR